MSLHIPNKVDLISKLNILRARCKNTYINVGKKSLLVTVNIMNNFANHLVGLQENKLSINSVFGYSEPRKPPNQKRPHIYGNRVGRRYLNPFLVVRQQFRDLGAPAKNDKLKISQESENTEVLKELLDAAIDATEQLTPKDASVILDAMDGVLGISIPSPSESLDAVNVVSGSRSVSKKKVSTKKATPKKKAVKVKRVKSGVFRRAED